MKISKKWNGQHLYCIFINEIRKENVLPIMKNGKDFKNKYFKGGAKKILLLKLVLFWVLYFVIFWAKTSSILSPQLGECALEVSAQDYIKIKHPEQNQFLKEDFFAPPFTYKQGTSLKKLHNL